MRTELRQNHQRMSDGQVSVLAGEVILSLVYNNLLFQERSIGELQLCVNYGHSYTPGCYVF